MRKFFIPLLMAGAMMPAAALAQDRDHQRGRGDEQRAERRAERAETNAADDRPQRQERAERPQREERAAQPQREQMVVRERSAESPQQPRFERRERRADQVQQVQQVEQVRQLEPARQVQGDQVRVRREGGFLGGLRETARQQQVLQAQPPTRDGRRDGYRDGSRDGSRDGYRDGSRDGRRDGYRDGNHDSNQRWSSHWRGDNRYDWRRHRDHNRSIFRLGNYYDPYGWGYRRFSIGFNIGSGYYGSNYWLDDPWMYRLPPAYGPYRWVRYYDDALLVNIYSGQVVDVINNFFW